MVTKFYFLFQGIGRRYSHVVLKKADIDVTKRAGELSEDDVSVQSSTLTLSRQTIFRSQKAETIN